ncbi:MAG TPA: YkvA family protein [Candidatus Acidoferrum sp.]|nr:YkvA family protein [Candidatus Acidoferrum sp.]
MKKKPSLTFEQATIKAAWYEGRPEKLRRLLDAAAGKSHRNFDLLLAPWESLQLFFRMIRAWLAGKYSPPLQSIFMMIASIIYFLSSFDVVPDAVPLLGLTDDAGVICGVARANLTAISKFRNWEMQNPA